MLITNCAQHHYPLPLVFDILYYNYSSVRGVTQRNARGRFLEGNVIMKLLHLSK